MADSAFGVVLAYEITPGGGSYTDINGVVSLSGPSGSLDTIDITDHQSSGGIREFIGGLLDWGEVSVEVNQEFDDSTHIAIRTTFLTRAVRTFRISFTDTGAATAIFAAIVTGYPGAEHPVDGKVGGTFTFKITGDITWAA
jgi:predicted secreted protein